MRLRSAFGFGVLLCILPIAVVYAQSISAVAYPAKPVRFISPFPPGGPTDLLSRPVGAKLQEALGQPFVIDYRAGAAGTIGADHVAKAVPDGYTLLVITASFNTAPSTQPMLPFDTIKDFVGVSPLARGHTVLIANLRMPAHNVKALVALAKAQPGKLTYASSGAGGVVHLGMEQFKLAAGINLLHVPYKGVGPAQQEVIAGFVDMMFIGVSPSIGQIKAGKVRAIAVASPRRSVALPDVPTIAEMGYPKFEIASNYGIMAPAATPRAIVNRLNGALEKILVHADIQKSYAGFGVDPWWETSERFTAWIGEDVARWAAVAKAINYQPGN